MCLRLHSDIKCDRTSLQVFTTSNSLRNIILPNSITSKETGAYYFKDTCVANLQALDNFFSVETNPTNLIVCDCVQVANIFECPALRPTTSAPTTAAPTTMAPTEVKDPCANLKRKT